MLQEINVRLASSLQQRGKCFSGLTGLAWNNGRASLYMTPSERRKEKDEKSNELFRCPFGAPGGVSVRQTHLMPVNFSSPTY